MFFSFFRPKIKASYSSPISGTIQVGNSYGQKTLFIDYALQSGGELHAMWEKVTADIQKAVPDVKKCLLLGTGGGTMIGCLQKAFPEISITAVDRDSIIVDVGKKYFGWKEDKNTRVVISDADNFVNQKTTKKYDLIIVDLYVKYENPDFAREKKYLEKIKILTAEKGVVVFNSHYNKKRHKEFVDFTNQCREVFPVLDDIFQYPRNHILLLRD